MKSFNLRFIKITLLLSALISTSLTAQNKPSGLKVAILLFEGVQIIDYTGPYEVLGAAGMDVFTVSHDGKMLKTNMDMQVTPNYSFDNCPAFDILLLPGGGSSSPGHKGVGQVTGSEQMMEWVKEKCASSSHVMTVCNGAFILAYAGLLDGQEVTTYWRAIPGLDTMLPNAKVVSDKRFTDNGKIITTAGLTSGIDGAFHLVEKIYGRGQAQTEALGLEYNWQPDANFARAALADKHMHFWLPDIGKSEIVSRQGDRVKWESLWHVWDVPAEKLLESVNANIKAHKIWTTPHVKWEHVKNSSGTRSEWKFYDDHREKWRGVVSIIPVSGKEDDQILSIRVYKEK